MTMLPLRRLASVVGCCGALGLALAIAAGIPATASAHASAGHSPSDPVVHTKAGWIHGKAGQSGNAFLGVPYAAPPTGALRWRPPQPVHAWHGVRDATQFAPSCPQSTAPSNVTLPPGQISEDCLYLNVYTPSSEGTSHARHPVIVWIHGGGLQTDGARNYDASKLAADGVVVVTINYRLGELGFLEHPALASRRGGATGNYGLMDQQAALRWVQRNIRQFGGDPKNVTIAGESAGGLSVLAQLVSPSARGLFQRAIVQSGAFALNQQSEADAEAAGEAFATNAGCPDQTAKCLRSLPVGTIVAKSPLFTIPGAVDGKVLPEAIGAAIAAGRYTHVPILDGFNHNEEAIFLAGGAQVSQGTFVPAPNQITPANYQSTIASVLGVSNDRAAAVASEYPLAAYPSANDAFTTLVADANFACPALELDSQTSDSSPTFAYQFNDDDAPQAYVPAGIVPAVATHGSELPYLFDLPNAPFSTALNNDQTSLAVDMRQAWANFAATGNPSSQSLAWPSYADGGQVMSFATPQPTIESDAVSAHHCQFWSAG